MACLLDMRFMLGCGKFFESNARVDSCDGMPAMLMSVRFVLADCAQARNQQRDGPATVDGNQGTQPNYFPNSYGLVEYGLLFTCELSGGLSLS